MRALFAAILARLKGNVAATRASIPPPRAIPPDLERLRAADAERTRVNLDQASQATKPPGAAP